MFPPPQDFPSQEPLAQEKREDELKLRQEFFLVLGFKALERSCLFFGKKLLDSAGIDPLPGNLFPDN
jgi:hypothetical protein